MTHTYTIGEAKTQLSKLIRLVEEGDEVVIRRGSDPVARLVPPVPVRRRVAGAMKGEIWMADDFDEWPEDIARDLGIID